MAQASLFAEHGPRVLVEDDEGGIRYWPGFVEAATAARWFVELRDAVDWRSERRPMYDRVVDVPRLLSGYRLDGAESLPQALGEIADRVRRTLGTPFNHVGLNRYRDGNDSVAPHPIALLSLGATRRMDIRAKQPPRNAIRIELEAGSLLVMSHAAQLTHEHGIPKLREPVGERISLAFRVRPPR